MNKDREIIYHALSTTIQFVETGEVNGPTRDSIIEWARTDKDMERLSRKLPWLSEEQKAGVQEIRELMRKVINGENI